MRAGENKDRLIGKAAREEMEPVRGFEPLTCGLRNRCSATELHRLQLRIEAFSVL